MFSGNVVKQHQKLNNTAEIEQIIMYLCNNNNNNKIFI